MNQPYLTSQFWQLSEDALSCILLSSVTSILRLKFLIHLTWRGRLRDLWNHLCKSPECNGKHLQFFFFLLTFNAGYNLVSGSDFVIGVGGREEGHPGKGSVKSVILWDFHYKLFIVNKT